MFGLGMPELIVIFIVALLLFGPKSLPDLGRTIGRALFEFKRAAQEIKESVEEEIQKAEEEHEEKK